MDVLENWRKNSGILGFFMILIDGLDEAEFYRTDNSDSVATFLLRHLNFIPHWIKLVVTIRSDMCDIVSGFPFQRLR